MITAFFIFLALFIGVAVYTHGFASEKAQGNLFLVLFVLSTTTAVLAVKIQVDKANQQYAHLHRK